MFSHKSDILFFSLLIHPSILMLYFMRFHIITVQIKCCYCWYCVNVYFLSSIHNPVSSSNLFRPFRKRQYINVGFVHATKPASWIIIRICIHIVDSSWCWHQSICYRRNLPPLSPHIKYPWLYGEWLYNVYVYAVGRAFRRFTFLNRNLSSWLIDHNWWATKYKHISLVASAASIMFAGAPVHMVVADLILPQY